VSTLDLGAVTVQAPPEPIFIGLDLSLTSTGIAVAHRGHATVSRVTSKPAPTTAGTAERLIRLVAEIFEHVPTTEHTHVAIEGPSFGSTGGSAHERGGLWWLVRTKLERRGIDTVIIPPTSVKKYATGKGNAPKDAVLAAVIRRYPDVEVTGNDEADALVLAAMCARHHGAPFDIIPADHAVATNGVGR
jgi:Holliday junction resolvasome RuvABC endonuclease subunit